MFKEEDLQFDDTAISGKLTSGFGKGMGISYWSL
jgi:hypothetical protein